MSFNKEIDLINSLFFFLYFKKGISRRNIKRGEEEEDERERINEYLYIKKELWLNTTIRSTNIYKLL